MEAKIVIQGNPIPELQYEMVKATAAANEAADKANAMNSRTAA